MDHNIIAQIKNVSNDKIMPLQELIYKAVTSLNCLGNLKYLYLAFLLQTHKIRLNFFW